MLRYAPSPALILNSRAPDTDAVSGGLTLSTARGNLEVHARRDWGMRQLNAFRLGALTLLGLAAIACGTNSGGDSPGTSGAAGESSGGASGVSGSAGTDSEGGAAGSNAGVGGLESGGGGQLNDGGMSGAAEHAGAGGSAQGGALAGGTGGAGGACCKLDPESNVVCSSGTGLPPKAYICDACPGPSSCRPWVGVGAGGYATRVCCP